LFSSELGSTPLYRYNEKLRLDASMGIETNSLNRTNTVDKVVTGVTEDLEDEIKIPGDSEDETPEQEFKTPPSEVRAQCACVNAPCAHLPELPPRSLFGRSIFRRLIPLIFLEGYLLDLLVRSLFDFLQ